MSFEVDRTIPSDHPSLPGHFPDRPIVPGVVILDEVVAALWPINDTAASLWASTFYAHLSAHPTSEEIAEALRASMLRLRDSRAFRHPRYWASLVHLARVGLPTQSDQRGNNDAGLSAHFEASGRTAGFQ